ncbi:MAG: UvrD-helicase domain-containing protein [Armatimonadetes bacterium]|nr:UvrD-helicase domain-containing protein [Armatimonadota bacterium]
MKFIADFHIHSHFSIATSKQLIPEYLDYWARLKGITVIGTGDFTHPGWIKELKEKLEPAEQGLFKLKKEFILQNFTNLGNLVSFSDRQVRFILTSEISSIYKKNGKVRKVHNVIFAPDFETVEKIQQSLINIGGNITSDGRPILGLDSKNLLEIALNASENIFFVPAHVWTPWFSVLGAKSGFDSIEECYEDLTKYIYAVETGLSSDPPMNWICSILDKFTLISNSDAHSPEKLGRNANIFDTELSYNSIVNALKTGNPEQCLGTIDLFPQEGKYHYDGHRKCGILWNPVETLQHKGICSKCGKQVTVGVMNRVVQLSDREDFRERKNRLPFYSIIPLKELLSEIKGVGPNSKKIDKIYHSVLNKIGPELEILLNKPIEEIKKNGNDILAEAIRRMRKGEIYIKEGFDGEFGIIKVFKEEEIQSFAGSLFKDIFEIKPPAKRKLINFDLEEYRRLQNIQKEKPDEENKVVSKIKSENQDLLEHLNPEQKKAVEHFSDPALIIAGPGTGKTRVIAVRIANLIINKKVNPGNILAVTFTNKAANEMKQRLELFLEKEIVSQLQVCTFHAFGYKIITDYLDKTNRRKNFTIIDEDYKRILLQRIGCDKKQIKKISESITGNKQNLKTAEAINENSEIFQRYEEILKEQNLFDLDDLIYLPVLFIKKYPEIPTHYRNQFQWIMVDEFQDVNFAQYQMIRKLMPENDSNLYVIGDPNQAIYGFRGADVKFIRSFINDYPKTKIYRLRKSYRCPKNVLKASDNVIQKNSEKRFLDGFQSDLKINISENSSDKSEAEFVARTIERMMGGLRFFSMDSQITEGNEDAEIKSLSDFVVLCRIKAQMKVLEKAFKDHSIPYQKVGTETLFNKEPVKSIIEIISFLRNPEQTFLKEKLSQKIKINEIEFLKNKISAESVKDIIQSIIEKCFEKENDKDEIKELIAFSENYGSNIDEFLKNISLGTEIDTFQPELEKVTLMTLHAAKGLEFQCVFIVGCEDGLLPYSLFETQKSDLEEEKRLLYVGMTRAKKYLYLTHAKKRFIMGKEYKQVRSPFLNRIEKELIEFSKSEYKKKKEKDDLQIRLFE